RTFGLKIRARCAQLPAIRLVYPVLKRVVGCSREVSEDLQYAFGLKNVTCISNTVDLQRVRESASEDIDNDLLGVFSRSIPVVINVAALEPQKGQDLLIQAHALLIRRGLPHQLLFVGNGTMKKRLAAL